MLKPVPWSLRDCLWAAAPAMFLFGWSGFLRFKGWSPLVAEGSNPQRLIFFFLLTTALWIVPVYLVAIRRRGGRSADLGFVRTPIGKAARLIGTAYMVMSGVFIMWGLIAKALHFSLQPDMLKRFPPGAKGLVLALLLGAVIAPIAEETFFRGFLFAGLRARYSFSIAAWGSALIFAAVHLVPGSMFPICILGFLLADLREKTGSIWPSIVMHMLNNGFYFLLRFAEHSLVK